MKCQETQSVPTHAIPAPRATISHTSRAYLRTPSKHSTRRGAPVILKKNPRSISRGISENFLHFETASML